MARNTWSRLVSGAMTAVLLAVCLFLVDLARPTIAKAGGLGDFYWYKTCKVYRYGEYIGGLTGKLSNYDIHNYADQRYHHGVSVTRSGWHLAHVLYNDESWPITPDEIWDAMGSSGIRADGTQDFDVKSTRHTVTFIFTNNMISGSCSITG